MNAVRAPDEYGLDRDAIETLVAGGAFDAFALLGPQRVGKSTVVRAFFPGANAVAAIARLLF